MEEEYKGKFIVVEGLDGSGKSHQIELLVNFLKNKGKDVILTKEPTEDSKAGQKIKKVLRKEEELLPLELQKLFVEDRKEHLEKKVIPALKEGKFVVSSRYFFSTIAYGGAEGLDVKKLLEMNKDFLLPDLTIIIDVLPEHCIERIEERGKPKEFFEQLQKLEKVGKIYKTFKNMFPNIVVINGEDSVESVFEEVKKAVLLQWREKSWN